jgi:hypothetical protein
MKPEGIGLYLGVVVLVTGVFIVDVRMPLGFTPWLLYVIPLGLTYWAPHLYAPIVVAIACTILVFGDYLLSPPGVEEQVSLTNRAFGTVTFWALGLLVLQYKTLAGRFSQLIDHLTAELGERTRDLGLAISAVRAEVEHRSKTEQDLSDARADLEHQVENVLTVESRRLQQKIVHITQAELPGHGIEENLDKTREELEKLGRQLEQLQRDLLP